MNYVTIFTKETRKETKNKTENKTQKNNKKQKPTPPINTHTNTTHTHKMTLNKK